MRYLSAIVLGLLAAGCNHSTESMSRFHDDGMAKPIAAVPAMIDTSSFDVPWSIAEELTDSIVRTIAGAGRIFVQSQDDFAIAENPFGSDLSWMKREFQNQEFAVFLELVEHELVPAGKPNTVKSQEVSSNLNMGVRVRVVDLRGATPQIVLQEMVRDSYFIPKTLFPTDYNVAAWGTEDFRKSPMGLAHAGLTQEIATRISEYILLAKSR